MAGSYAGLACEPTCRSWRRAACRLEVVEIGYVSGNGSPSRAYALPAIIIRA